MARAAGGAPARPRRGAAAGAAVGAGLGARPPARLGGGLPPRARQRRLAAEGSTAGRAPLGVARSSAGAARPRDTVACRVHAEPRADRACLRRARAEPRRPRPRDRPRPGDRAASSSTPRPISTAFRRRRPTRRLAHQGRDRGRRARALAGRRRAAVPLRRQPVPPDRRAHPSAARRHRRCRSTKALATSNNQCFAQLAVHELGATQPPRRDPALRHPRGARTDHSPGSAADPVSDRVRARPARLRPRGLRITPLAAARMAGVLADGQLVHAALDLARRDGSGARSPAARSRRAAPRAVSASSRRRCAR